MVAHETDVVVIGTGPGGEGAAMQAVKLGKRVTVIEANHDQYVGGNCTHRGTIPSKALRQSISHLTSAANNPLLRGDCKRRYEFPALLQTASNVISRQTEMRQNFYIRNDVDVVYGVGRFLDEHTIAVNDQEIRAKNVVIATGSRPYRPANVDFAHPRIFDSDTILKLGFTPMSITVYGAGVIGSEYASMFRNLGVKVNLVNTRTQLLEFLDDEIIDALSYHLRDQGVIIRHCEQYEKIVGEESGVITHLASGKKLKTDVLLWANGRSGNTEKLNLDAIDLEANSRGQLEVNEHFQTKHEHIYAVGDVIGYPSLASAAYMQGRAAAEHIVNGRHQMLGMNDIPTGIYTSPEISSVGQTERELTEAKVPYEVGHAMFKSLARAQIRGRTVGMLKLLFHRETLEILGVHCFGDSASEIVHIGQAIMAQEGKANSLLYFINTTFNYPTMAEAYRVAALNGYNRLF